MINYIQLNKELLNNNSISHSHVCSILNSCNKKPEKIIAKFSHLANMRNQKTVDMIKDITKSIFLKLLHKKQITCDFVSCASRIYHNIDLDDRVLILYFCEKVLPVFSIVLI